MRENGEPEVGVEVNVNRRLDSEDESGCAEKVNGEDGADAVGGSCWKLN